ncbi:MAG: exodeoxyribonuclease III [Xanthomonadaceae bacterium]|nr:exodeoxyribonuclease III [Xanthomonadaceae bacterium]
MKSKTSHLISWNVNGYRAVQKSGFVDWMKKEKMDVLSLQEIKVKIDQLEPELVTPHGYHATWFSAEKPGYSGVATFSKEKPLSVKQGLEIPEFDLEGRVLTTEFDAYYLVNAYFPNSQRDHARLGYKLNFCEAILKFLKKLESKKPVVLCGDYNIAHEEIDLMNPKSNHKTAGFLPEERQWMSHYLKSGFCDVFRQQNPGATGHYSWWSYRPGVREKNIGWRIDYHTVSEDLVNRVKKIGQRPEIFGSDHCPIEIEILN